RRRFASGGLQCAVRRCERAAGGHPRRQGCVHRDPPAVLRALRGHPGRALRSLLRLRRHRQSEGVVQMATARRAGHPRRLQHRLQGARVQQALQRHDREPEQRAGPGRPGHLSGRCGRRDGGRLRADRSRHPHRRQSRSRAGGIPPEEPGLRAGTGRLVQHEHGLVADRTHQHDPHRPRPRHPARVLRPLQRQLDPRRVWHGGPGRPSLRELRRHADERRRGGPQLPRRAGRRQLERQPQRQLPGQLPGQAARVHAVLRQQGRRVHPLLEPAAALEAHAGLRLVAWRLVAQPDPTLPPRLQGRGTDQRLDRPLHSLAVESGRRPLHHLQLQHHLQRIRGPAPDLRGQEPAGRGSAVHRTQERLGQRRRLGAAHRRPAWACVHADGPVRLLVSARNATSKRGSALHAAGRFLCCLLGLCAATAHADANPPATAVPDTAALEAAFDDAFARYRPPGLAVGVVVDGDVVFARTRGELAAGSGQQVDRDTLFKIASNSKAMTAAVLARLVDQDKLDWTDPVVKHLPEFRMYDDWVSREMQVRDLLIHNSGLGAGAGDLMLWPEPNLFTRADVIHGLRYLKPAYSFRSRYAYDNTLYIVAGEVAAAAGGAPFDELLRRELFEPLGMRRCQAGRRRRDAVGNVAQPHRREADGRQVVAGGDGELVEDVPMLAAGGIRCSLDDMLRWATMWLQPGNAGTDDTALSYLSPAQREEVWKNHMPMPLSKRMREWDDSHFSAYGYGWRLTDVDGTWKVSHTGTLSGMYSALTLLPQKGV